MNKETHQGQLMKRGRRAPGKACVGPTFFPGHTEIQQHILGCGGVLWPTPPHTQKSRKGVSQALTHPFQKELGRINRKTARRTDYTQPGCPWATLCADWVGQGFFPGLSRDSIRAWQTAY